MKPFDVDALDEWRCKYFEVRDVLSVDDNVLSCGEFSGRQDKLEGYFARLKNMCREFFEKLASACYEDSIVDVTRVPLHLERLPKLIRDMDNEAKKFGIAIKIVGNGEIKKALNALVETASLPFFESVGDAKAA